MKDLKNKFIIKSSRAKLSLCDLSLKIWLPAPRAFPSLQIPSIPKSPLLSLNNLSLSTVSQRKISSAAFGQRRSRWTTASWSRRYGQMTRLRSTRQMTRERARKISLCSLSPICHCTNFEIFFEIKKKKKIKQI